MLLPQSDKLRFLPGLDFSGEADLLYVAWDGSQGKSGGRANITFQGGGAAFSTNAGEVAVIVTYAAHAPTWTATNITLTPVEAVVGPNNGETVQAAFGSAFANPSLYQSPNATVPTDIAVIGLGGTTLGTWEYKLSGSSGFVAFPTKVTTRAAVLLEAGDTILFVPKSTSFNGTVSLTAYAWDGTNPLGTTLTDGESNVNLSNPTSIGGTTPFSSTALTAMLHFNQAPTQNPPANSIAFLPAAIAENAPSKAVSVGTLLKSAHAGDLDKNALGMALTGDSGNGVWQYELHAGTWQNFPVTLSEASLLLLPGNALLRFSPTVNQAGNATLSWEAWDGTQGAAGQQVVPMGTDGAFAFSNTSASATLTVNPSQRPPAWSAGTPVLMPVVPANTNPSGNKVSTVFGPYFQGPSAAGMGIAVSGVTGTANGQWQYSSDGVNWTTLPRISPGKAYLLLGSDYLRFLPSATGKFPATASLTAYAWDGAGTGNTAHSTVKPKGSDFSIVVLSATILVNDAPTLTM
jgi:hypothetical protein